MSERKEFHEELAEKVIKMLEDGTAPWIKPWEAGSIQMPFNPLSGTRYKGGNALALYNETDPRWMTYKQAKEKGYQVKKGEKGTRIQYWKLYDEKIKRDEKGKPIIKDGKPVKIRTKREYPSVFHSTVFNASQIDGIPDLVLPNHKWDNEKQAESIIKESGAILEHKSGNRAYYQPSSDSITMPEKKQFDAPDKYYATLFHELGHWTGHESRLDRDLSGAFGSESYAKEELRAEISSFIRCAELGLGHDPSQHAAYIKSWVSLLKNDPKEITRACSDAEKINKFVMSFDKEKIKEKALEQSKTEVKAPKKISRLKAAAKRKTENENER